jgi:hypothetical protein
MESYFPTDRGLPCYAVYATAIDRFLLVDRHDLAILVRATTLFSSKMVTVVCIYDSRTNPRLTDDNCIAFAPVRRFQQSSRLNTSVVLLSGPDAIVEMGPPPDTISADMVARAQRYLSFTVRATYAQFIANAWTGVADIRVVRDMLPELETLPGAPLSAKKQVVFPRLRNQRIEEILYYSDTVEQATADLEVLLRGDDEARSTYRSTFDQVVHGRPTPSS